MQWPLVLAQHFHGDRALTRDHFGVIKRMDECQAMANTQFHCMRIGIRITVAKQHHLTAQGFDRINFERRGGDRHDNDRPGIQFLGTQCHPLRMVTGRGADHAFFELGRRQLHHLVVSAAQFEAEHRLLVFTLEQHLILEFFAEYRCHVQSRLVRHVIHLGGQNFFQIICWRELALWGFAGCV